MQNEPPWGQDSEVKVGCPPSGGNPVQPVPVKVHVAPPLSTAAQNDALAHDTEVK
jgi:hypothetical protein